MLFVSVMLIGISGKKYIYVHKSSQPQELEVEKQSVQALKNTFAEISEVKFEQINYDNITDLYGIFVTIKNTKGESTYFPYVYSKNNFKIDAYRSKNDNFLVEGITKNKVKVIYSNGKKSYI